MAATVTKAESLLGRVNSVFESTIRDQLTLRRLLKEANEVVSALPHDSTPNSALLAIHVMRRDHDAVRDLINVASKRVLSADQRIAFTVNTAHALFCIGDFAGALEIYSENLEAYCATGPFAQNSAKFAWLTLRADLLERCVAAFQRTQKAQLHDAYAERLTALKELSAFAGNNGISSKALTTHADALLSEVTKRTDLISFTDLEIGFPLEDPAHGEFAVVSYSPMLSISEVVPTIVSYSDRSVDLPGFSSMLGRVTLDIQDIREPQDALRAA